jgi:hypothetical protein
VPAFSLPETVAARPIIIVGRELVAAEDHNRVHQKIRVAGTPCSHPR